MFNKASTLEELAKAFAKKDTKLRSKKLSIRDMASARQMLLCNFHARRMLIMNGN